MDNITYVLYICFLIPMALSLFIMQKKSRLTVAFILIGTTVCLLASEVNNHIYLNINRDMLYFTTTVSPVTEELLKALPILLYALFISDNRQKLAQSAFAVGLGFAIMENVIMITQNLYSIDIKWAIMRGFGASLMHSICTVAVGIGISFVRKKKKLFYCGTLSLLMLAITYHSIYNTLVMSPHKYYGIILPICTYIPLLLFSYKRKTPEK
ncbi:MAG: PrsW family intramembrane metalloprotease [Eubacterium sp.]|nr:PrsW family intramembrane metalloprotease [Eubacterium sp.]